MKRLPADKYTTSAKRVRIAAAVLIRVLTVLFLSTSAFLKAKFAQSSHGLTFRIE